VISNAHSRWIRLCGVMAVAAIIFASVLLPSQWEQLRTGHWAIEHFLAYCVATWIVCLGWRRPFVVAGGLAAVAAPLLETLQGLEPTHSANLLSVLSGAGGALTAALLAKFIIRLRDLRAVSAGRGSSQRVRPLRRTDCPLDGETA
jgi:hypothetical protein